MRNKLMRSARSAVGGMWWSKREHRLVTNYDSVWAYVVFLSIAADL